MGCDIHGWVEYRFEYGDGKVSQWHTGIHAGNILDRNYEMFAKIFGVRGENDEEGEFGCRGLPRKLSWRVDEEYKKGAADYHSETHCTAKELFSVQKESEDPDWNVLFVLVFVLTSFYGEDNVRLVVWFDN